MFLGRMKKWRSLRGFGDARERNTRIDRQARAGWARPRRESDCAGAAGCGHGSDLYRAAANAGNDCVGGGTGGRGRDWTVHFIGGAQYDLSAADEIVARKRD